MKKILVSLILISSLPQIAQADCMFKILNYSDSPITTTIGFYGESSMTFVVAPAETAIEHFKSDYDCKSVGPSGLGKSFVLFPKDPAYGGANYSPENDNITLMGKFSGTDGGRELRADNGIPIWLNTMGSPMESKSFEIKLNFTGRPNSKSAGTQ